MMTNLKNQKVLSLVDEAVHALLAAERRVTITTVCAMLVRQHASKCSVWKKIPLNTLYTYVHYCIKKLKVRDLTCAMIPLLHEYIVVSGGEYPKSYEELAVFYECGTVPAKGLEFLQDKLLNEETAQCCLCKRVLGKGSLVIQLSCKHYCCSLALLAHVTSQKKIANVDTVNCNIRAWLQVTNRCPTCEALVELQRESFVSVN